MPTKRPQSVHQLKITLLGSAPAIWRRLPVTSDVTLHALAAVINGAMGWQSYHLHEFHRGQDIWGPALNVDEDLGYEAKDDRKTTLAQVAPRKRSVLKYEYDSGDGWLHKIVVEDVLAPAPQQRYPDCLDGSHACPPEDCGGIPGYADFLAAISDPGHPEHDAMVTWIGGPFDPAMFEVATAHLRLRGLR